MDQQYFFILEHKIETEMKATKNCNLYFAYLNCFCNVTDFRAFFMWVLIIDVATL